MYDRVVKGLSKGCQRGFIGPFLSYGELFTSKLSEQNDYPEVVKIHKGCHRVIIAC